MASAAHLIVVDASPTELQWAEQRLRELECRWSRFLVRSEISRLNRSGGGTFRVHPDTIVLIETMQHASALTGGRYDPTMLCEIVSAGYSSSIDDPRRLSVTIDLPSLGQSVRDIAIDRAARTISLPSGLGLDPGGIGKGLAGDLVVSELMARGAAGALACIGGDLAFAGEPPRGPDWEIAVGDAFNAADEVARIGVTGGGVATSSTRSRRWKHNGTDQHHILDPRTRAPSSTDLVAVTIVASAGWEAEALATAAILENADTIEAFMRSCRTCGIAVAADGTLTKVGVTHRTASSRAKQRA